MPWPEVLAVLVVSHLVGDFVLQTEWQATQKRGGLVGSREARRALLSHGATYLLCYVPALVWLAEDVGWSVVLVALGIVVPHVVQDDATLLRAYVRRVKKLDPDSEPVVMMLVDQSLHVVALFLLALVVGA